MLTQKDGPLWMAILDILDDKIDEKDRILVNFEDCDQRIVDIRLAEKREILAFKNMFENLENRRNYLNTQLGHKMAQLDERNKQTG
jgi:hypothetical protein